MDKLYQQLITVPLLLQIIVYTFIATAAILLVILIIKRKDKHISDKLENRYQTK